MKATDNGRLRPLDKCTIEVPPNETIIMKSLPEIGDQKNAIYNNEAIIGRATPLYTYSHSGDRTINMQIHFLGVEKADFKKNLRYLRILQSAVYPREGTPYLPPPICKIKCGDLLAGDNQPVCCVLQSYNVKFPTEVGWWEENYCPYRFDVDTSWLVVYTSSNLPFAKRIVEAGY